MVEKRLARKFKEYLAATRRSRHIFVLFFFSLGGLFKSALVFGSATYTKVKTRSRRTRIEGGTMYVSERLVARLDNAQWL